MDVSVFSVANCYFFFVGPAVVLVHSQSVCLCILLQTNGKQQPIEWGGLRFTLVILKV